VRVIALRNKDTGAVLAEAAWLAESHWARLRGLIGRRLLPGGGMVITPCSGIHTFFMSYPIDVLYIGRDGRVLRCLPALQPNRFGPLDRRAHCVVELPVGTIARTGTQVGHELEFA
jgi:uncharacterized membrane protein (UPF0127 family)